MDLPTADSEQLAAFIVCIFSSCLHLSRIASYCPYSVMSVCWLSGPPPSRPSFPLAMISRTGLSSYCGEPVPRLLPLKEQAPLQTPFPVTLLPSLLIHSGPPPLLVIALPLVFSLPPPVRVSRTPSQFPVPTILKRVLWLPRQRPNELGMVKSTLSMSIQMRRSLVPPYYTHVYTTAQPPGSVCVSRLCS